MAATETQEVGLNLSGDFAEQALRAAAAGEKLSGSLGGVEKAAGQIGKGGGASIGQKMVAKRSPWADWKPPTDTQIGGGLLDRMRARWAAIRSEKAKASAKPAGAGDDGGAGAPKDLKYLLKNAGIGRAAQAAVGAAAGLELTKLALGVRGMAQFSAITTRASLQFRQLFRGVDPSPVIRGANQFFRSFDAASVAGRAMGGIFTRTFNGLFKLIENAEPYITAFAQGGVLGALYLEKGWLKARIALYPLTEALGDFVGQSGPFYVAAGLGGVVLGALAVKATIAAVAVGAAAAPFIAAAAAIGMVISQVEKLAAIWDSGSWQSMWTNFKSQIGVSSQADTEAAYGIHVGAEPKNFQTAALPAPAAGGGKDAAKAGGQQIGQGLGQGIIEGMDAMAPAVAAAGERIGKAGELGARRATETHSPSEAFRRVGRDLGAGEALGIDDSAPAVQAAAERSMVPRLNVGAGGAGGGRGGAAAGARGALRVTVRHEWPEGIDRKARRELEDAAELGTWRALRAAAASLGVPVEAL